MELYFSAETLSFLTSEIHGGSIPAAAIEISIEEYRKLLQGQSEGKRIGSSDDGRPILLDPPPPTIKNIGNQISSRRFLVETSSIEFEGTEFSTSRDSQASINGALLTAMQNPNYRCCWKTSGGFVELNAVQIKTIAGAIRSHVQACFDREAELLAHLEAGTYEDSMLDQGWPA
ncbi:DUF4376 domain-containing protein [Pseudomonas sp. QL9]|uniref:DUF4376 domain-containing protein n=1 Tax=Pseudomonas sp. QL9 TaxID=3242725 RepID=UPI003529D6D4